MSNSNLIRYRERNPRWKGGTYVASNGYVVVLVGTSHHLSDGRGYAYQHRLVAEIKIGRRLLPKEQVHHINGVRTDNRQQNLEVHDRAHHGVAHRKSDRNLRMPGQENPEIHCECGCGSVFEKFNAEGKPRRFVWGHSTVALRRKEKLERKQHDGEQT